MTESNRGENREGLFLHTEYEDSAVQSYAPPVPEQLLEDLGSIPEGADISTLIREKNSYEYLYHLTHLAANPVKFTPFSGKDRVLELGGGCGTVTGALADRAAEVTSVVLTRAEAEVNAYRNRNRSNVTLYVGAPSAVLPHLSGRFDVITILHAPKLAAADEGLDGLLRLAGSLLAPGGRILLTASNRIGLKFFAGNQDASGSYFQNLEGRGKVVLPLRSEWERLLLKSGFSEVRIYNPYPDERFPISIYSDAHPPGVNELSSNNQNFGSRRLYLFDETRVFGALLSEGLFSEFTNGFLIEASVKEGACPDHVLYAKYSNERNAAFSIRTYIEKNIGHAAFGKAENPERGSEKAPGRKVEKEESLHWEAENEEAYIVRKIADTDAAAEHIRSLPLHEEKLRQLYAGSGLRPNRCIPDGKSAVFEFVRGTSYDRMIDETLKRQGTEAFHAMLDDFMHLVIPEEKLQPFRPTSEFADWFGEPEEEFESAMTLPVTDLDCIMANVLFEGEGLYTLIDYEWTVHFPVPADFVKYRIIHYYLAEAGSRSDLSEAELLLRYGIDEPMAERFAQMERHFQEHISEGHVALVTIFGSMSPGTVDGRQFVTDAYLAQREQERLRLANDEAELERVNAEKKELEERVGTLGAELAYMTGLYDALLDLYEVNQNDLAGRMERRRWPFRKR
jgi:SAM-dependent methyltransferase